MHARFGWPATLFLTLVWMALAPSLDAAPSDPDTNCLAEAKASLTKGAQADRRIVECLIETTTDLQTRTGRLERLVKHPKRLSPPAYSPKSGALTPGGQQ